MWTKLIKKEKSKPYFKELLRLISLEKTVYPPEKWWYHAFDVTPYDEVKVVIIGQDPYHQKDQAHGLAFSTLDHKLPKSLINIFKELENDLKIKRTNGNLTDWAKQGVLLLNTCLTVTESKPLSHQHFGWENLIIEVIRLLNEKEHLVFILWGNHAKKYLPLIDQTRHHLLISAHPSPLAAHRGFFGSKPFSKTNDILCQYHIKPVIWG